MGLNFRGNHTIHVDPNITLNKGWMRPGSDIVNNRATEKTRGSSASRWDVDAILASGYALVTAYYGDIDPDYDDDLLIAISIPVAPLIVAGSPACVNNLPFCPGAFFFASRGDQARLGYNPGSSLAR